MPVVSIIMPVFNREALVDRALASVLQQSYTDFEVLVVDDGSTDGTAARVAAHSDPRVHLLRRDRNYGQASARNLGVARAQGWLLAFQDSDDEWMPEKLARQVALLMPRHDLAMVYGDLLRVPRTGASFVIPAPDLVKGHIMDRRSSGYASYGLGIQTCLMRASSMKALGGFRDRLHCFEDMEFFLRLTRRYASCRIPEPLVRYHDAGGVSGNFKQERAARRFLLREFAGPILCQRPSWFWRESVNLRQGRSLDT